MPDPDISATTSLFAPPDRAWLVDTALGRRPADVVLRNASIVNVITREIVHSDVILAGERIASTGDAATAMITDDTEVYDLDGRFVAPGLIDPHVHIESSNLTMTELTRAIVPQGVLTLCADPHEIANVLGLAGIDMLFTEARALPINLLLRVPARVPALPAHLETSGYEFDLDATVGMLRRPEAVCMGGDINPALVLDNDPEHLARIAACAALGKTVGGQLPGFTGPLLDSSAAAGLADTHVAESVEEVIEQLRRGMRVLLTPRPDRLPAEEWPAIVAEVNRRGLDTRYLTLCSDDTHPNLLRDEGHLERRLRLAIEVGFSPLQAIQMATINTADLMRLDRDLGSVSPGRIADLVILDSLDRFEVDRVFHCGQLVAAGGRLVVDPPPPTIPDFARNTIHLPAAITAADLGIRVEHDGPVEVQVVEFGGPKTMHTDTLEARDGVVQPDPGKDVVAIAVIERHKGTGHIGRGFVGALGVRGGAVASTVNHDSHNIVVIGDDFESMAVAANAVAEVSGGYCAVVGTEVRAIAPLPIAGLLTDRPLAEIADAVAAVERVLIDELGCPITYRPIYALNFLCLPNIPDVGFTDFGVIVTRTMEIVPSVAGHGHPA